tara:strand:+ start:2046 stop:2435 length:390 start_codon:yes stop_codon:yes gene_type:complete
MAEFAVVNSKNGVDTLFYEETDTGVISVIINAPPGIWEVVDLSVVLVADDFEVDKAPPSASVVSPGGNPYSFFPMTSVTELYPNYWTFTYNASAGFIIETTDTLRIEGEDYSTSVGNKVRTYLRARRMR